MRLGPIAWGICLLRLASARPPDVAVVHEPFSAVSSVPQVSTTPSEDAFNTSYTSREERDVRSRSVGIPKIAPVPRWPVPENESSQSAPRLAPALKARAPEAPEPLDRPSGRKSYSRQNQFIGKLFTNIPDDNRIGIVPSEEHLRAWQIDGTAIGATADWLEFGDTRQTWVMQGLTGCTASIVMSSKGFWAGHLWEDAGPERALGGSSFLVPPALNNGVSGKEWDDQTFQKIAVDIHNQPTPAERAPHVGYVSFKDLKDNFGDPLGGGSDVEFLILTKSTRSSDRSNTVQQYASKVDLLKQGYRRTFRGAREHILTYAGDPAYTPVPPESRGKIIIQYTPYEADDCDESRVAAAVVWVEDRLEPAFEKEWTAPS